MTDRHSRHEPHPPRAADSAPPHRRRRHSLGRRLVASPFFSPSDAGSTLFPPPWLAADRAVSGNHSIPNDRTALKRQAKSMTSSRKRWHRFPSVKPKDAICLRQVFQNGAAAALRPVSCLRTSDLPVRPALRRADYQLDRHRLAVAHRAQVNRRARCRHGNDLCEVSPARKG